MPSQEVTPPVILAAVPTAKEKKYDRQLRLWAASGQQALEDAKVLLLNNGPGVVGVETLKNLVLPGVGSFTIVDGAIVSESDLGLNFFLEESSLGKSRAAETSKFLKELNPDVEFSSFGQVQQIFLVLYKVFELIGVPVPDCICPRRLRTAERIYTHLARWSMRRASTDLHHSLEILNTPVLRSFARFLLARLRPNTLPLSHC